MKKKNILILILLLCTSVTYAQHNLENNDEISITKKIQYNTSNKIRIHQDKNVDKLLLDKYKKQSKLKSFRGYRIQVFSGGSDQKNKALNARYKFNKRFPNMKSYIEYNAPTFRVKVGSFRTKLEAARTKHRIIKYFPDCYIVKDRIKFENTNANKK